MNRIRMVFLAAFVLGVQGLQPVQAKPETLKEVPKDGEIPHGKIVYVDDKKCPKGEIKEITGGSKDKAIPRRIRCVKRPAD
jgi:hypothetical protein